MSAPAGWYPDPEREGASRWWDGELWAPSLDADASDAAGQPAGTTTASSGSWPSNDFTPSWESSPVRPSWETDAQAASSTTRQHGQPPPTATWTTSTTSSSSSTTSTSSTSSAAGADASWQSAPPRSKPSASLGSVLVTLAVVVTLGIVGFFVVRGITGADIGSQADNPTAPITTFPSTVSLVVDRGGEATLPLEIAEPGIYTIDVRATNDEDPRITLVGDGVSLEDDDGGDGTDSLLSQSLAPGTYTLGVTEYSGDPLAVDVTVTQHEVAEALEPITELPASVDVTVPADTQAVQEVTITEQGTYVISAISTNGEDPKITLLAPDGTTWDDDDGGDGTDSLLEVDLEPGEHTILVEEFSGDALTVTLEVSAA